MYRTCICLASVPPCRFFRLLLFGLFVFLFVFLFCLSVWFLSGLARRHPFLSHLMFVSFICFHRIAWSRRVPDTERCIGAKKRGDRRGRGAKNSRFFVFSPDKPSAGVGVRRATCAEHFAQRDLSRASAQSTCAEQLAQSNLHAGHVPKKLLRAYVRACVRAVAFFCWFVCVCVRVYVCAFVCALLAGLCVQVQRARRGIDPPKAPKWLRDAPCSRLPARPCEEGAGDAHVVVVGSADVHRQVGGCAQPVPAAEGVASGCRCARCSRRRRSGSWRSLPALSLPP